MFLEQEAYPTTLLVTMLTKKDQNPQNEKIKNSCQVDGSCVESLVQPHKLNSAYKLWYNELGWQVLLDKEPHLLDSEEVNNKGLEIWKAMTAKERHWWANNASRI